MRRVFLLLIALLAVLGAAYGQEPGVQITTTTVPNGEVGAPYSFQFTATGGSGVPANYSWSAFSGTPADLRGLSMSSAGVLSGTPTSTGDISFFVQVFDPPTESSNFREFTMTIAAGPSITSTSPLPNADVGSPYSFTFAATGGQAPYTWSGTSLPAGLSINSSNGVLSGTPTTAGPTFLIVQLRDAAGAGASSLFDITINPALVISTSALPVGVVGTPYNGSGFQFVSSGGQAPYTWSIVSGSTLGLTLSSAGVLSGTPTAAGTPTITVQLRDGTNSTVQKSFTLPISTGPLTITNVSPMPTGQIGSPYTYTFGVNGGIGPYTWGLNSGTVPAPGLSLNSATGVLSGTPTEVGSFSYLPYVMDAYNNIYYLPTNRALALSIVNTLTITNVGPMPVTEVNVPYSYTLNATGGVPPYTWSLASGTNPAPGISFNAQTGVLSGTATTQGTFAYVPRVTDSRGNSFQLQQNRALVLTVGPGPSVSTTSPLPAAIVGTPYSLVLSASGGVSPYTWTLISGSPPPGLSFDGTGRLAGTPTTEGTYTFSVQVRDSLNGLGTAEFVITVNPQLTILTTSPLTDGTVGTLYRLQFAGKGGQTPYIWTIASGSLPQGLSLNTSGALTGTPTAGGTSSFGVKLTDLQGTSVTATFSITVAAAAKLTITSQSPLPDGKVGVAYNAQLAATGGSGTLSWSIQTGSLPAGLSLSSAGLIGGTPTAEGTSSVTVVVTDSATPTPQRAQQTFSITVTPSSITITTTSLPAGTGGSPYSATLAATGGTPPYSWSLAGGSLPSGVTLNATSGAISGTPSAGGSFAVTVGVADSTGATGTKAFTLVVNVPQAPSLTISDLPTPAVPNQQPQFRLALAQAYPLDISGQLTLTFSSTVGVDDPMIRFANGTRVLGFTVPAGATAPVFGAADRPVLLTGTTAGTITLTVTTYQAGGQDVQPIPPPVTIQIPAGAPVITSVTATRNSSGFTVRVAGFTTQRQVTRARFQFNGTNLQTTEVSPPVDSAFNTWFQSTQSNQFGTQFSLTQPFNVQGDPQTVTSVTVTLSSAAGDSTPATAQLQ